MYLNLIYFLLIKSKKENILVINMFQKILNKKNNLNKYFIFLNE